MLRISRTALGGLLAAVLVAGLLLAPSASASARRPPDPYLALGDSVAFGFRPSAVTDPSDYLDAANFRGYPEVVGRRLDLRVANAACPGETTASLIDASAQSNGCSNSVGSTAGYRSTYPLHVSYASSQLDHAVRYLRSHPRTRLVSIGIGANDLFICQRTSPDQCTGTDFPATVEQVQANLDTILVALRQRAHYRHRLVVVTYYSLDYRDAAGTAAIRALDDGIEQTALARRARVADGFGVFRRASSSTGGDPCAAGLLIALPTGGCDIHPTVKGHRALARAVVRAAR